MNSFRAPQRMRWIPEAIVLMRRRKIRKVLLAFLSVLKAQRRSEAESLPKPKSSREEEQ